jgi:RND superfamily putative drug exporter
VVAASRRPTPAATVLSRPAARIAGTRRLASLVVAGCVAGLLFAAFPLLRLELGVSFVDSLPADTEVRRAPAAARQGFADGILSPTVVLIEGDAITSRREELARLGSLLKDQPGVAGVLGPGDVPIRESFDILLARNGDAARYLVVLSDEPLGAAAITSVNGLSARLPELLQDSQLTRATAGVGGDTATASYIVAQTERDLVRIAVAALLVNLAMLLLFLRAALASVCLLGTSLLSVAATLGVTSLVFDHVSPGQGLTFYVPFAAAVLLLAFGSDYNIFGVGHIWDEARHLPLSEAIVASMPGTARALTAAGLALGASFGLLAIVPLLPFRQLAFAMLLGILLDVFVVRLVLMPALLTALGPVSTWPNPRLRHHRGTHPQRSPPAPVLEG